MDIKALAVVSAALLFGAGSAHAVTVSFGAGSAVTTAERTATFDSINLNTDLTNYTEDGLLVSVNGPAYLGFDAFGEGSPRSSGFYYRAFGSSSFVTIKSLDGEAFSGLEFLLGHGQSLVPSANVVWEARLGGNVVDGGGFTTQRGTVIGFTDVVGFDELRIGAHGATYTSLGQFQSIALDDLRVGFVGPDAAVPVPGAIIPMLSGLGLIVGRQIRRKRQA